MAKLTQLSPPGQSGHIGRNAKIRAYLSRRFGTAPSSSGQTTRTPAEYDKAFYMKRHRIENLVSGLKDYRAIATRYDTRAANFLSGVYVAAALRWII